MNVPGDHAATLGARIHGAVLHHFHVDGTRNERKNIINADVTSFFLFDFKNSREADGYRIGAYVNDSIASAIPCPTPMHIVQSASLPPSCCS